MEKLFWAGPSRSALCAYARLRRVARAEVKPEVLSERHRAQTGASERCQNKAPLERDNIEENFM